MLDNAIVAMYFILWLVPDSAPLLLVLRDSKQARNRWENPSFLVDSFDYGDSWPPKDVHAALQRVRSRSSFPNAEKVFKNFHRKSIKKLQFLGKIFQLFDNFSRKYCNFAKLFERLIESSPKYSVTNLEKLRGM